MIGTGIPPFWEQMIFAQGNGSLWEKRGQYCTSVFKKQDTVPSLAGPAIWLNRVRAVSIGLLVHG